MALHVPRTPANGTGPCSMCREVLELGPVTPSKMTGARGDLAIPHLPVTTKSWGAHPPSVVLGSFLAGLNATVGTSHVRVGFGWLPSFPHMHCSHVIWSLAANGRVPHPYFDGSGSGPHHEVIASNGYGCRPSVRVVLETIGLTINPGHTRGSRRRVPLQIWRTIVRTLQLWARMGNQ